jgi:hypothetical protein
MPHAVAARAKGRYGRRPIIPFEPSRPGSWVAGVVEDVSLGRITYVALYGLLEELSDASVHRSLSDISPILSDPDYRRLVLIGGDLNTSTQWLDPVARARDEGILRRFEDYGLVDCLRQAHEDAPLDDCPCAFGDNCRHTWTRRDPANPSVIPNGLSLRLECSSEEAQDLRGAPTAGVGGVQRPQSNRRDLRVGARRSR